MNGSNNYRQSQEDWHSSEFRQHVINQIMEAMRNSCNPTTKSAREMEAHIFGNADCKERYLNLVARLILHMKDNRKSDGPGTRRTSQTAPMLSQAFAQNQCNPTGNQTVPPVSRPNIQASVGGGANVNNPPALLTSALLSSSSNGPQPPTSISSQGQGLGYSQVSIASANAYCQQGQGTNQSQYPHQVQPNPSPCSQTVAFPNPSPYSQQPIMKSPHSSQPSQSPYALQQPIKSPHSNQSAQFAYVQQPIKSPHTQPQVGPSAYVQQQAIRSPHPSPQVNSGKGHHSQAHQQIIKSPLTTGHPANSYQQQQPSLKSPAHPQSVINNRSPYPAQNIKSPVQQPPMLNNRSPYPQPSIKSPYPQSQPQQQQSSKSPFYPQIVQAPTKSPLLAPSPVTNVTTPNSVTVSQSPATNANPGSVGSVGGSVPASSPLQSVNPSDDAAYMEKLRDLTKYIAPLRRLIDRTTKEGRKKEIHKMKSLLEILANPQKRVPLATLTKCESVLEKLQASFSPQSQPPSVAIGTTTNGIAATNTNGVTSIATTTSNSSSNTIVSTTSVGSAPVTTSSGLAPSQDVCKPLIDIIAANLNSPALAYALQQTCGPAFTTMRGPMTPLTEQTVKRKRIKYSDSKMRSEQENVIETEMTELDDLFVIEKNVHPLMDSESFLLKCSIDDASLPPVPSIYVIIPEDYPYSSAQCQTTTVEYRANPFFVTIIEDLSSRLLKMPRVTLTGILNAWKLSILKAYSKDEHEFENLHQQNSFIPESISSGLA
ncbi:Mediator of RNA polymerase II transcription subunit 15 [Trichoplax sp. H2]|nr:Mediator of RNA polymerase II transcription subunit 15 [Trichoplax sp. H2]|eukprot:RDD40014.1 Mediator of RNA polymerase II transcription subunit 15 [Trichoplax sp. H2]